MTNTLGLVGDMDDVDLLVDVEACFGIGITNSEAESCHTVGDLFTVLSGRFSLSNAKSGRCLSAMAFYRLRRAVSELHPEAKLRPDTRLAELTKLSPKALYREIENRSGLRLRTDAGLLAVAGKWVLLAGLISFLPVLAIQPPVWFAPVAAVVIGGLVIGADRGKFPPDCELLGGLANKAAARNIGRLTIAGGQPRDADLRNALTEVLSDHSSLPKSAIRPDTRFFKKERKAA